MRQYQDCFVECAITSDSKITIFKRNQFKMAINFRPGVRYTNQKGKSLPTINLSFGSNKDEEILPSKINWRKDNYGHEKCTERDCNCFFADKNMLEQIDVIVNKSVMPVKLQDNVAMYQKFYNDTLEMYADQGSQLDTLKTRILALNFESYHAFSSSLCKKCGERINSNECESKCGVIIAKQLQEYNDRLKEYSKVFDEFKKDNTGVVEKKCHFCPIIIVGQDEKPNPINFFAKYLPEEIMDDERRFKQFTGSDQYYDEMPSWFLGDHIQINIQELRRSLKAEENNAYLPLIMTLLNTPNLRIIVDDCIYDDFFALLATAMPEYQSDPGLNKVISLLQNTNTLRILKDSMGITINRTSEYFSSLVYFQGGLYRYPGASSKLLVYKQDNPHYPCYQCSRFNLINRKHNTTMATNILPADNAQYDSKEHPLENMEPMDDLNEFAHSFNAASMRQDKPKTTRAYGPSLNKELNDYEIILGNGEEITMTVYDDQEWDN